ncbi:MAG: prepilin-type N-terminal cleavage/methylation domain-containing protein [Phycisphaeraceae bacterium]|nr:prepilin-type N-terminal cleavage/methylation domain-containing protein [Phycisphaeraceae bacterium]MCW5761833.1 prepilin-type N-terminal cleavage/methylation domain-containing protein [Phycisphaeraceae bacterium]
MSRVQEQSRGFSLVELLTVIAIIALVISIIIPVLGGARDAGRRVSTQGLLSDIANAASKFKLDNNGRNPGYFSEREMGSADNATRGMSGMENAMLDLGGQKAIVASAGAGIVSVGPIANQAIFVNPNLVGADEGAYFKPSREYFVAQTSPGQQVGVSGHTSSSENDPQLLDVVDSFGQPVLFWSADTHTVPQARSAANFASIATGAAQPAMFYWNSNAAFLQANNLGRKGEDMTLSPTPGQKASLIGSGAGTTDRESTLRALLGSASAPATGSGSTVDQVLSSPSMAAIQGLFPARGRGAFVVHAAGRDGIYLSAKDRGFGSTNLSGNRLDYGMNFFQSANARLLDDENKPSSRDVASEFDDIIVSGN